MREEDWYANRILWRAELAIREGHCEEFEHLSTEDKDAILNHRDIEGTPLLLFGDLGKSWTVVTHTWVVSFFDGSIKKSFLDDIAHRATADTQGKEKMHATYVLLGHEPMRIWAPPGRPTFSLPGILQVFPL